MHPFFPLVTMVNDGHDVLDFIVLLSVLDLLPPLDPASGTPFCSGWPTSSSIMLLLNVVHPATHAAFSAGSSG